MCSSTRPTTSATSRGRCCWTSSPGATSRARQNKIYHDGLLRSPTCRCAKPGALRACRYPDLLGSLVNVVTLCLGKAKGWLLMYRRACTGQGHQRHHGEGLGHPEPVQPGEHLPIQRRRGPRRRRRRQQLGQRLPPGGVQAGGPPRHDRCAAAPAADRCSPLHLHLQPMRPTAYGRPCHCGCRQAGARMTKASRHRASTVRGLVHGKQCTHNMVYKHHLAPAQTVRRGTATAWRALC